MKKLVSLFLCICLISALFVGCSEAEKPQTTSSSTADGSIDAVAAEGKLDGVKFGLGADIEEVKAYYEELAAEYEENHGDDNHDHGVTGEEAHYYQLKEREGYNIIDVSSARFYYETEKEDKGISVIATDSDVFGFTVGTTTKYEVEDAIKAKGDTLDATANEIRFLAVPTEPLLVLRYEFDDYQLDFYFYDNLLITTVIVDTNNWKL